ncbi:L-threonylcarbamoyladenylate synthase [Thermodesulfovibrio aggregans]|uniref:L-threonylcarbamoyladenylate synthase n=1 Tax=Thermodesulfovibrio aggregans TaxID=86166 RepID=A0A0U9HMA8_9BACT|nr:L-threonylcarbamoyladenylate synthase [Thermodesulfovibrio aggregans]GAQ93988.1 L-threonylcarbamoyladenylate synthase [Thermodesulfovibrio aggregans]
MKLADATKVNIKKVLEILENDGIIIYPTETLYGIGARFDSQIALKKIFEIKKRPKEKSFPLIVNLKNLNLVVESIPKEAQDLIEKFWPGPLTLLLPAKKNLPEEITKDGKVAVRMPGDSFALRLIKESSFPITATSANLSGLPPADCIDTVVEYFKETPVDLIIDGGKLPGIPSTIVDVTVKPPKVIRKGAIELSFDR